MNRPRDAKRPACLETLSGDVMRFKNQVIDRIWLAAIGISFVFWVAIMIEG